MTKEAAMGGDPTGGTDLGTSGSQGTVELPTDALEAIKDAYNNLVDAIEAAGLPGPPHWG